MTEEHSNTPPSTTSQQAVPTNPSTQPAPESISKEVLKQAYVAFKKRWKLTKLDEESRIGRGPMSSGQKSTIIGIQPPNQFPAAVWETLVEQGKIKRTGRDQYALS